MTPSGLTILLAVDPVDMRLSFDGLAQTVQQSLRRDAKTERMMFAFVNRRRDMLKILWRDATGWCVLGKRLDERVVTLPKDIPSGSKSIVVDARTLAALLEGVVRRREETTRSTVHEARAATTRVREEISRATSQLSTTNRR